MIRPPPNGLDIEGPSILTGFSIVVTGHLSGTTRMLVMPGTAYELSDKRIVLTSQQLWPEGVWLSNAMTKIYGHDMLGTQTIFSPKSKKT